MLTRAFRYGNSVAVRIPKALANFAPSQAVEIERVGDTLVIHPLRDDTLSDVLDLFAAFSSDFMAAGREFEDDAERGRLPTGRSSTHSVEDTHPPNELPGN